ncbi:hypothetical protein SAMN05216480_12026 [Pustulibacterium marinum]|uniref:Uncharacterized protein n=1 Tax=Pustulibacterium marinum TaxID=1224947 RepID=A0A1I7IRM4_9FLAO|nr:hypothetical protein [Pustulibacterium marinum]SFU75574.1 hypothetical protein SAMN05216480_12026 [Pustulibacterium marinum]
MKTSLKKTLLLILSTLGLATITMIALFQITTLNRHQAQGFVRYYPPHLFSPDTIIDVGYNSYYPAGYYRDTLYFGNTTDPSHMLGLALTTLDTIHNQLTLPNIPFSIGNARLYVLENQLFLTEGHTPLILSGTVKERTLYVMDTLSYFQQAKPYSSNHLMLKIYDGSQSRLARKQLQPSNIKTAPHLLTKQQDGLFDMDGQLHITPTTRQLVYVYRYRNTIVLSDTTFTHTQTYHTIDTITKVQMELVKLPNHQTKFAKPPLVVNKNSAVTDSILFVHSALKSNNEEHMSLTSLSVIDLYDLNNGHYLYSGYIPNHNRQSISYLYIVGQQLYALFGSDLVCYTIHLPQQPPL